MPGRHGRRGSGNSWAVGLLRKLDDLDRRFGARAGHTTDWEERQVVARGLSLPMIAALVALLIVPVMAILLVQTVWNQQEDSRVRETLERDGGLAVGTVTEFKRPLRGNVVPDEMRVEFMTERGKTVTAWVPVSHLPAKGARIEVRYVRSNPSVARVPGDETPHRGRWIIIAGWGPTFFVIMVVILGLTERFRRMSA